MNHNIPSGDVLDDSAERLEKKEQLRAKVQALVSYYEDEKRRNEELSGEVNRSRLEQGLPPYEIGAEPAGQPPEPLPGGIEPSDPTDRLGKKEQLRAKVQALVSHYEDEKRRNEELSLELERLRAGQSESSAEAQSTDINQARQQYEVQGILDKSLVKTEYSPRIYPEIKTSILRRSGNLLINLPSPFDPPGTITPQSSRHKALYDGHTDPEILKQGDETLVGKEGYDVVYKGEGGKPSKTYYYLDLTRASNPADNTPPYPFTFADGTTKKLFNSERIIVTDEFYKSKGEVGYAYIKGENWDEAKPPEGQEFGKLKRNAEGKLIRGTEWDKSKLALEWTEEMQEATASKKAGEAAANLAAAMGEGEEESGKALSVSKIPGPSESMEVDSELKRLLDLAYEGDFDELNDYIDKNGDKVSFLNPDSKIVNNIRSGFKYTPLPFAPGDRKSASYIAIRAANGDRLLSLNPYIYNNGEDIKRYAINRELDDKTGASLIFDVSGQGKGYGDYKSYIQAQQPAIIHDASNNGQDIIALKQKGRFTTTEESLGSFDSGGSSSTGETGDQSPEKILQRVEDYINSHGGTIDDTISLIRAGVITPSQAGLFSMRDDYRYFGFNYELAKRGLISPQINGTEEVDSPKQPYVYALLEKLNDDATFQAALKSFSSSYIKKMKNQYNVTEAEKQNDPLFSGPRYDVSNRDLVASDIVSYIRFGEEQYGFFSLIDFDFGGYKNLPETYQIKFYALVPSLEGSFNGFVWKHGLNDGLSSRMYDKPENIEGIPTAFEPAIVAEIEIDGKRELCLLRKGSISFDPSLVEDHHNGDSDTPEGPLEPEKTDDIDVSELETPELHRKLKEFAAKTFSHDLDSDDSYNENGFMMTEQEDADYQEFMDLAIELSSRVKRNTNNDDITPVYAMMFKHSSLPNSFQRKAIQDNMNTRYVIFNRYEAQYDDGVLAEIFDREPEYQYTELPAKSFMDYSANEIDQMLRHAYDSRYWEDPREDFSFVDGIRTLDDDNATSDFLNQLGKVIHDGPRNMPDWIKELKPKDKSLQNAIDSILEYQRLKRQAKSGEKNAKKRLDAFKKRLKRQASNMGQSVDDYLEGFYTPVQLGQGYAWQYLKKMQEAKKP